MRKLLLLTLVLGVVLVSSGCGTAYRPQQGAMVGAAFGALAGQAIGRDTESTLIGTALGAAAGAVIGDAVRTNEYNNNTYPVYQYNYPYNQKPQYNPNQAPQRRY